MFSKKKNRLQTKENISGYAFVAPALTCFILFMAFPFFLTLILSFFDFNFLKVKKLAHLAKYMKFCGFENFVDMTKDRRFIQSIINTAVYTVTTVPASIILGLILAYVMHGNIYGKKLLRLAFFIPYISSIVALGAVFKFLFREDGIVNNVLLTLNLASEPIKWSVDPAVSKIPIILLSIWSSLGYVLIIYMAAIENVPKTLYEAASIDGASSLTQFIKITVPLISPTTFYLIIVRMIAVFKIFSSVNIFTMGSSITSNTSIVQEIYSSAFGSYTHGYASAQSVVLLAIILIITAIQFWGQKKWVHY
ncbi:MAG: sugar ABC transporter permease [Oscillospiraceae bacterium]|nr:sugar ABC transporter permease [Oscillospiraceae bacterium]